MMQAEFESAYATNAHRQMLYAELLEYLDKVKQHMSDYSLIVFGSFVSDKETPGDVDLILHGRVRQNMLGMFDTKHFRSKGHLDIKLEVAAISSAFRLRTPGELVQWFEGLNADMKVGNYKVINF